MVPEGRQEGRNVTLRPEVEGIVHIRESILAGQAYRNLKWLIRATTLEEISNRLIMVLSRRGIVIVVVVTGGRWWTIVVCLVLTR